MKKAFKNALQSLEPQDWAFNLAVTRFFYFAIVFVLLGANPYFLEWKNVPAEFWFPTGPLLAFDAPPFSAELYTWIFHIWRWTLPLCALGFGYRILAPLNFVTAFALMNFAHSFGYQTHTYMPVLLVGFSLSFAAASDVLSFDVWIFRRWMHRAADARVYRLPLRTAQLTFTLVFFAAAVSKLRASGLEWFTSDTLRNYFLVSSLTYQDISATAHRFHLNYELYTMPVVCHILAFLTMALELSAPLAFFKRRASWFLIPALLFAQVFIFFAIYVNFKIYLAAYAVWINWRWLADQINSRVRGALHRRANV